MGNEMNELRYLDLKNTLCEKIYEGVYKDGEKIPSERQLSTDYDVSRITVRKTLELMEKENLIVREVGNGTRVTLKMERHLGYVLPDVLPVRGNSETASVPYRCPDNPV
mgnify:CR=1 FL=1